MSRSTLRRCAVYALITLVPVATLGVVLALRFQAHADQQGLAEGRSEAALIAETAVSPRLDGRPLSRGLSARERAGLTRMAHQAVRRGQVLRLRLRDLAGNVVFSDDGSGFGDTPDDEAIEAAHGQEVAGLTDLNSDVNDHGRRGQASVEIYLPLGAGSPSRRVGVLEVYLPYAPIASDVNSSLHALYVDLGAGLAALYLLLFAITLSATRGLRRESAVNAFNAHHDLLTDLPNRTLFLSRCHRALVYARKTGQPLAIAVVDLDHFKDINDTLGHQSGDLLLIELARRVNANMRPGDTVARLGGDEFGLILRNATDPEHALVRLREVIKRDIEIRGLPLSIQPTIGFVSAADTQTDVDTLLRHADVAMYSAKDRHVGVLEYRPDLRQYDPTNFSLIAELGHAISAGELVLHYQPQTDARTGAITAVECLVRWQHPRLGLLGPDAFLPFAEQTDLIDELTSWVLRTALTEMRQVAAAGFDLPVAINVSARTIGRTEFARDVLRTVDYLGVKHDRLIVEVTETALLTDPARAARVLSDLARAGIEVSLDDFGRGQTSLGYLSALPIHELKIDRSFVTDMLDNPAHGAIVRAMIDLGHSLAMRVVAEGIETHEVLMALGAHSCDLAQGYYIARPMPASDLQQWLLDAESRRLAQEA